MSNWIDKIPQDTELYKEYQKAVKDDEEKVKGSTRKVSGRIPGVKEKQRKS